MNLQLGLERISAAWWGFCGLFAAFFFFIGVFGHHPDSASLTVSGLVGMGLCYALHRVTCWVIAGFFSGRS